MPRLSILTPTIRKNLLHITEETLKAQTFRDFEWIVEIGDPTNGFTLPADYNKMLKKAKGDIILSLQDCISLPPDFLEKFMQLPHDKAYTFPVVKEGKPGDWRTHISGKIPARQWELDLGSAPMKLFKDVGGFDEAYCGGWSCDNVEIGWRAEAAGWEFECISDLRSTAYDHDEHMEHPFRTKKPSNAWKLDYTKELIEEGNWKLSYLD